MYHITPCLKATFEYCKIKYDSFPHPRSYGRMNIERLNLSQNQVGETLAPKENTTIYSDETPKKADKFIGFGASDAENRMYLLGIRDLATKSANDTFHAFQQILSDFDSAQKDSNSKVGKEILCNIRNTMSDRAATEVKWHEMLENYRANILPKIRGDWDKLSEEERKPIVKLQNYYCGLHSFVQAAEQCGATLLTFEPKDQDMGPRIASPTEPGAVRLIRTAAKAFACGGDQKNGVHGSFKHYAPLLKKLTENEHTSIPLVPFRENRFNIVFSMGGLCTSYTKKCNLF